MGEIDVLILDVQSKIAEAFQIPERLLTGVSLPLTPQVERDLEAISVWHGNLIDKVFTETRIQIGGRSNRYRTYVKMKLSGNSFETVTYVRPSKGFAKHNRRVKQSRRI